MGVGATGILKCARSPAGAGGGRVAVTLHRKPPGGWSWRVGLRRKDVREEGTACAQPAGVARSGGAGQPCSRPWSHTGGPAPWDGSAAAGLRGSTQPCPGLPSGACWAGARSWCCRWLRERAWPRSRTELRGARLKTLSDPTAPASVLGPPAADRLSGWLGFPGREWAQLGGAARAPGLRVVGPAASTLSDPLLCLRPVQ